MAIYSFNERNGFPHVGPEIDMENLMEKDGRVYYFFSEDISEQDPSMEVEKHDRVLAAISHLPHIAASALVNLLSSQDDISEDGTKLAAGGFRDITRIASASPEMWLAISLSNKEMILDMMDKYIAVMSDFRSNLVNSDEDIIFDWFAKAKAVRDSLPDRQSLSAMSWWDLHLDVEDSQIYGLLVKPTECFLSVLVGTDMVSFCFQGHGYRGQNILVVVYERY